MKIAVITGEESGDKLAASAIKELKLQYKKNIHLFGIGGNALKKQGIDNLFDISEINVMGLIEVLPKVLKINTIINIYVIDFKRPFSCISGFETGIFPYFSRFLFRNRKKLLFLRH